MAVRQVHHGPAAFQAPGKLMVATWTATLAPTEHAAGSAEPPSPAGRSAPGTGGADLVARAFSCLEGVLWVATAVGLAVSEAQRSGNCYN